MTKTCITTNRFFCLLFTLLTFLVYYNSFHNSFHFDDLHVIEKNPYIKNPQNLLNFFIQPAMGSGLIKETSSFRPLLMITFAFNHYMGGLNVFGYHVVNLLIHLGCTILLYFILLLFLGIGGDGKGSDSNYNRWVAFFGALFFAIHPIQTESITYITGRSSSLTALFFLFSFWAFLKYGIAGKGSQLIWSSGGYACALLVKETAVTLPAILVLFNMLFPLGRTWKRRILSLFPHLLVTGIYLLVRLHFFGSLQYNVKAIRPLYDHLLTQLRAWVHFLGTLLFPLNLNADYDFPISHSILDGQVVLAIFILGAIVTVIWKISQRQRLVGFFALWFGINLAPTSSIIRLEDMVADRWLYLPSVGFMVIMVLAGEWVYRSLVMGKSRARFLIFFFLCTLSIELYGFATVLRNFDWGSEWTLWEDTMAKSPNKARGHIALGLAFMNVGKMEEAVRRFQYAMQLDPKDARAYLNLGLIYYWQDKYEEASQLFQKAIRLSPRVASEAHNNLGLVYLKQGRKEQAVKEFHKAIEMRDINPNPYYNLGTYYENNGETDRAIFFLEKSLDIDPEFYWGHLMLSRLYEKKGWKEKSLKAYRDYVKNALSGRNYLAGK